MENKTIVEQLKKSLEKHGVKRSQGKDLYESLIAELVNNMGIQQSVFYNKINKSNKRKHLALLENEDKYYTSKKNEIDDLNKINFITHLITSQKLYDEFEKYITIVSSINSPIEALFLSCFIFENMYTYNKKLIFNGSEFYIGDNCDYERNLSIEMQKKIGPYKVDFMFELDVVAPINSKTLTLENFNNNESALTLAKKYEKIKLIIECDGHDFHEKTKEMVKRDKEKDRYMQSNGYSYMRFTGSEIWQDSYKCIEEVLNFLDDRVEEYETQILNMQESAYQ